MAAAKNKVMDFVTRPHLAYFDGGLLIPAIYNISFLPPASFMDIFDQSEFSFLLEFLRIGLVISEYTPAFHT